MNLIGNWNYPTSVRFGPGRIRELAEHAAGAGMKRPLLVTDPGLTGLPMIADALALLRAAGLGAEKFDRVQPNPIAANVADGLKVLREGKHDGVIAFGGGSALDAGKVIAFMAGQTRPMWDFEDVGDWWTRADPDGIAPIIAVRLLQTYKSSVPIALYLAGAAVVTLIALAFARETKGIDLAGVDAADAAAR